MRQNFILFLTEVKQYPATLIAVEKQILLSGVTKRFDIVLYNRDHQPYIIVECKKMNVKLDEAVLRQILNYHLGLPSDCLVLTNGQEAHVFVKKDNSFNEVFEFPAYGE